MVGTTRECLHRGNDGLVSGVEAGLDGLRLEGAAPPQGWWEHKQKHSHEQSVGMACGEKVLAETALLGGGVHGDKGVSAFGGSRGGEGKTMQALQCL